MVGCFVCSGARLLDVYRCSTFRCTGVFAGCGKNFIRVSCEAEVEGVERSESLARGRMNRVVGGSRRNCGRVRAKETRLGVRSLVGLYRFCGISTSCFVNLASRRWIQLPGRVVRQYFTILALLYAVQYSGLSCLCVSIGFFNSVVILHPAEQRDWGGGARVGGCMGTGEVVVPGGAGLGGDGGVSVVGNPV